VAADLYDEMAEMAVELLTEFNQAAIVLTRIGEPIPGATAWDLPMPGTDQSWTLKGISEAVDTRFVDGAKILSTDRQLLIAPFEDEPRAGDILTINGAVQTVLAIQPVTERACAWIIVVKA